MQTILVVDDDGDLRSALAAVLSDAGYRVCEAENGMEALAVLEQESVDLAIVDVMMPVMDGLQLFDSVRAGTRVPQLPIMLLTASRLGPSALGHREVRLVHKPVGSALLLAEVARLLNRNV